MYIVYFIPLFVIAFIALMLFGSILSFLEWLSDIIYFLANPAFIKYILMKIGIFDLILPLIKKRPKKQILNVFLLDAAKTFALIRLFCIIMPYYQKCWSSAFSSLLDITLLTILILLILVIPLTRLLVGKTYGSTATIVPLVIAAAPFVARMVESSLKEVDPGVIEAAVSMGAGTRTIIWKVLLAESRTSLLVGVTIAVGTILGYSAMAGTVGGGGLGDIAIRYGYYRYQTDIMIVTIVILVVLVQILQGLGMMLSRKLDKRKA